MKELTNGGAHVSVDALGRAQTVRDGLLSLRKRGRHVQLGLTSQEEQGMVAVPIDVIVGIELTIVGNNGNAQPHYPRLLELVAQGNLNPRSLITRKVGLADVDAVLRSMTEYQTVGFNIVTQF